MLNQVSIIGRVGRDPEVRSFPDGGQVANLAIATTEKWKDRATGEPKEHTEWHRVNFSGRLAEIAGEYLKKGSLVFVQGSLRTREWTDKDQIKRYATEIRGDSLKMLGPKNDSSSSSSSYSGGGSSSGGGNYPQRPSANTRQSPAQQSHSHSSQTDDGFADMDDDIPF